MFFDHDPDTFPDEDPKPETVILDDWLEIIEAGFSIEASKSGREISDLAEELELAKTALKRGRGKLSS